MTEREYLDAVRGICRKRGAKEIILYGSRAKRTNLPMSDFDIAVSGSDQVAEIREEIDDLPTLYQADVVDFDSLENQELREDIIAYGISI